MRHPGHLAVLVIALWIGTSGCGQSEPPVDDAGASPDDSDSISTESSAPYPAALALSPADSTAGPAEPPPTALSPADSLLAGDPSLEAVLAPLHDVEIVARLEGDVVAVQVEEGQRVAAGAVLARLDDREPRALLAERQAEAERAEAAWSRAQRVKAVISEEHFIAARSEWRIAKARRDQAAIDHARCVVRAPIAGIVSMRRVQKGQTVKEGTTLFRVSDPDWLRAELLLPESYRGKVHPGQGVRLVPVAGGASTEATVTRVNPLVDPASGTFRVVIDVDNREARLPAGIAVRAELRPAPDPTR